MHLYRLEDAFFYGMYAVCFVVVASHNLLCWFAKMSAEATESDRYFM